MLSPDDFEAEYPPEELAEELPDEPISSLRSLQFLYGKLYTLATAGGGKYAPYLTPDAAGDLVDTEDSLIIVRVDLSGSEPRLDDSEPVSLTTYTDGDIENVAHCKYAAARGIDHSVTHQAGRNSDPEKLARYAKERLTKWATDDIVDEVATAHDDGWIIESLGDLGANEDALDTIESALRHELDGESATALLTVQVRTEAGGGYQWPGTLDVFNEAMRRRKLSKLVTKNKANDSSGDATDLVSGQPARTVGTSEDPQNYYLGKQLETFPGLDIEEAWRTHPISEDAAVTVMNAETFVEACTYRTFGAKVYYLPYFFGRPTVEETYKLYGMLHAAVTEDDDETPIERAYDEFGGTGAEDRLRFYVSAVMPHQMSRYDVFGETLNGRLLYPRELAREHDRIVGQSGAFVADSGLASPGRDEWTAAMPTNESWDLLSNSGGRLGSISTGWYFYQTFAERDDADADADDPRIEALVAVLSGDSIAVETLLGEYVDRIVAAENDDEVDGFPFFLVASQFAQLCALADEDLGLLTADTGRESITDEPTYDDNTMQSVEDIQIVADGGDPATAKLESFIEATPALTRNGENADETGRSVRNQRRGAFLLGALVGAVGNYQEYHEDRSTTLVDNFPVKSISQSRIKKVTQDTIGKTLTYTRERKKQSGGFPGTLFEHLVEELRETIADPDPDDWTIDTDDLRFYYALGVTYGMNDRRATRDQAADSEEEP